jgi:acetyl esterase/lipase
VAPYPAGLNDCVAAVAFVAGGGLPGKIGRTGLVLAGDSGGGNLALATALRIRRRQEALGTLAAETLRKSVCGVYLLCPYLAGVYPDKRYPSTVTHRDVFLPLDGSGPEMYGSRKAYDARDPCAWPAFAQPSDLEGLPPVFLSLNEMDPLVDEGRHLYRKLLGAGVPAQGRVVLGTAHGADFFGALPDVTRQTAQSVALFARTRCGDRSAGGRARL